MQSEHGEINMGYRVHGSKHAIALERLQSG